MKYTRAHTLLLLLSILVPYILGKIFQTLGLVFTSNVFYIYILVAATYSNDKNQTKSNVVSDTIIFVVLGTLSLFLDLYFREVHILFYLIAIMYGYVGFRVIVRFLQARPEKA